METIFTYTYRDNSHTVRLEPQADGSYLARIGDCTYHVQARLVRPGRLQLQVDGAAYDAYIEHESRYENSHENSHDAGDETMPDDRRLFVALVGKGEADGRRRSSHYALTVSGSINAQGTSAGAMPAKATGAARRAGHLPGELEARMPGQVTQVLVHDGDLVSAGQTLVVLSAMKMETRLVAPADGRVARVLVQEGETVERGRLLVELAVTEAG